MMLRQYLWWQSLSCVFFRQNKVSKCHFRVHHIKLLLGSEVAALERSTETRVFLSNSNILSGSLNLLVMLFPAILEIIGYYGWKWCLEFCKMIVLEKWWLA